MSDSQSETFWRELTERVRQSAHERRTSPQQELQQFVLQRIMARTFSLHPDRWMVKGGQSLLARFPDARASGDVDLVGIAGNGRTGMTSDFNEALQTDLGDHLTFEPTSELALLHGEGVRLGHRVRCGGRELMELTTDLLPPNGRTHWVKPDLIPFPHQIMRTGADGENPRLRVLSVQDQLAHKISGMYMQNTRNDETKCAECLPKALGAWSCRSGEMPHRVQDLVDVAFLAGEMTWDAADTHAMVQQEFVLRIDDGEPLSFPSRFRVPNPTWVQGYAKYAAVTPGLQYKTLRDVWPVADAFVTPLLRMEVPTGQWDPARGAWANQSAAYAATLAEPARQRILVVAQASGRKVGLGGLPVVSGELTTALAARDDTDVTLLTFPGVEPHGDATVVEIPRRSDWSTTGQMIDLANNGWPAQVPGLPPLGSDTYDVVVGHSRFSGPAAMHIRNRWYRFAKLVYVVHNEGEKIAHAQGSPERAERYAQQEREVLDSADLVVGVGPLLADAVRQATADDERRPSFHELVPGVSDTRPLPPPHPDGTFHVLFTVHRVDDPTKGWDDLPKTMQSLREEGMPVRLRVRGVAEADLAAVQESADAAIGATGIAEVLPYTTDINQLRDDHAWAHVAVMPSKPEGYGMVAHEAAALGVPVLVTEDSGFGRLMSDSSRIPVELGWQSVVSDAGLTGEARTDAWRSAITELATDYPACRAAASGLRTALAAYTWQNAADSLTEAMAAANPDARRYTVQAAKGRTNVIEDGRNHANDKDSPGHYLVRHFTQSPGHAAPFAEPEQTSEGDRPDSLRRRPRPQQRPLIR